RSIWKPIKICINALEGGSASLADCFIYMIKLAIAIYHIPDSIPFKPVMIQLFNRCYIEFQHPCYLLCYYFHPFYHRKGFKNEAFRNAAITASTIWKSYSHTEQECKELISQFRYYDARKKPFDLSYVYGLDSPML
ncbi:19783_t:CDS:2, partial [Cetraspora pellucida]